MSSISNISTMTHSWVYKQNSELLFVNSGVKPGEELELRPWSERPAAIYSRELEMVRSESKGGHAKLLEDTARRYAELREEILEKYKDDQNEMYKHLEALNWAFENALRSTTLHNIETKVEGPPITITYLGEFENTPEGMARLEACRRNAEKQMEADILASQKYMDSKLALRAAMQNSLLKYVDMFYESFIEIIQQHDFDTAFAKSMDPLKNSESSSLNKMSYSDAIIIRDSVFNRPMTHAEREHAVRELANNSSISNIIRDEITKRFEFNK